MYSDRYYSCFQSNTCISSFWLMSTDCDEGWALYNGHCYIRNTTALSQPEAMVQNVRVNKCEKRDDRRCMYIEIKSDRCMEVL